MARTLVRGGEALTAILQQVVPRSGPSLTEWQTEITEKLGTISERLDVAEETLRNMEKP